MEAELQRRTCKAPHQFGGARTAALRYAAPDPTVAGFESDEQHVQYRIFFK
jgi:hypothetical protein